MRRIVLALLLYLIPVTALAGCTNDGYTIIFVNGVLISQQKASEELGLFQREFTRRANLVNVNFRTGYNPSHLAGVGDAVQSIFQAFNNPVSDFDLNTILMQIHPQVTTRKILLLGHSQGSFYVNEMYKYLINHGVQSESIAVYEIATPASYVAGGGQYVTSTNDKVMNLTRDAAVGGNVNIYLESRGTLGSVVNSALRANITIPPEPGYADDSWGGHHFDTYMDGASARIVNDISAELSYLKILDSATSTDGCFTPPTPDIKYKMQAAAFMALEPIADNIKATETFYKGILNGAVSSVKSLFSSPTSVSNSSPQVAAAAVPLAVVEPAKPSAPTSLTNSPKPPTAASNQTIKVAATAPAEVPVKVVPPATTLPVAPAVPSNSLSPGYGGGGGGTTSQASGSPSGSTTALTVSQPAEAAFIATTTVTFTGTSIVGALVTVAVNGGSATTTTDVSGNWSAQFALPEGVYSADISAESSGVAASHIAIHFTVDTTPPTVPVLTAVDCAASLVSGMCVLPESRVTLSWTSDGTSYRVAKNGVPLDATTLSEETEQLSDGATTTFAVVAYDAAGNAATSTAIDIVQLSKSVVINEISWAGDTNPAHQWIELKNLSSYAIDLSRVSVSRSGGDPIQLSGTLPGYVAGRREHIAVVEPVAVTGTDRGGGPVLIILFPALSTSGEKLSLIWNTVPIDSTPEVGTCNGWCAGSLSIQIGSNVSGINNTYSTRSMERADNAPDGLLASSWHSTDGYGEWLGNSSALPWGTPGTDNSQGWPDAGVACDSSGPIEPNHTLHSTSGCVILTQFITGGNFGAGRYVATYRGDVGNSTGAGSFEGVRLASGGSVDLTGAHAGDHYFFAAFENRIWANDAPAFQAFFTDGSQPAPHGNYLVVPFTYAP